MNRHNRRAAAAKNNDIQWTQTTGSAHRDELLAQYADQARTAVGTSRQWAFIVDTRDRAAHQFAIGGGRTLASMVKIAVGTIEPSEGARFLSTWNERIEPDESEVYLASAESHQADGRVVVLVVGGGGSMLAFIGGRPAVLHGVN